MDEALQYAIDFCHEDLPQEETARRGEIVIQSITGRLGELGEKEGMTTYIMGGVLKRLKRKDTWRLIAGAESLETWGEFCDKIVGKKLGACYAKIRVWEKSQKLGMSPLEIERIGWSIADVILRESKDRNDVARLTDLYNELGSREKFLAEVQKQDEERPKEKRTRKKRYLRLDTTEDEFYSSSLELAASRAGKELHNGMSEEQAVIFALAQWREGLN